MFGFWSRFIQLAIVFSPLISTVATADADVDRRITYDRVRADLEPTNTSFLDLEVEVNPYPTQDPSGLLYSEVANQSIRTTARMFARLSENEPSQIWLMAQLHGQPTPAFNGRRMTPDGHAVCNLKVFEHWADNDRLPQFVSSYAAKISRYSHPEPWVEYLMKRARVHHGVRRDSTYKNFVLKPGAFRAYLRSVTCTRRMMQIFGVGKDRPARMYINVPNNPRLHSLMLNQLSQFLEQDDVLKEIVIIQADHYLTSIVPGHFERADISHCAHLLYE